MRGARANLNFNGEAGGIGQIVCELLGPLHAVVDPATTLIPTYQQTKTPPVFLDAGINLNNVYKPAFQNLSLATGNNLSIRTSANDPSGYISTLITGRRMTGSFDPEAPPETVYAFWNAFLAGVGFPLTWNFGTAVRNRVQLSSPRFVTREIGDWERCTGAGIGAYLGLVPSEHSSGSSRSQGSITKTGNRHIRRVLVESAWAYRHAPAVRGKLRERRACDAA